MSYSKANFNSIYDIAIIGAGAAGLFCAALAAARGKKSYSLITVKELQKRFVFQGVGVVTLPISTASRKTFCPVIRIL